jgi:hypothetical protein
MSETEVLAIEVKRRKGNGLTVPMTVNTGSRAVMERVGLTYVRTFPTSTISPVEGVEEGEVEYEMTREQCERGQLADLARSVTEP